MTKLQALQAQRDEIRKAYLQAIGVLDAQINALKTEAKAKRDAERAEREQARAKRDAERAAKQAEREAKAEARIVKAQERLEKAQAAKAAMDKRAEERASKGKGKRKPAPALTPLLLTHMNGSVGLELGA